MLLRPTFHNGFGGLEDSLGEADDIVHYQKTDNPDHQHGEHKKNKSVPVFGTVYPNRDWVFGRFTTNCSKKKSADFG
jgi:hypothetical protein